jgi:hypothetical protein
MIGSIFWYPLACILIKYVEKMPRIIRDLFKTQVDEFFYNGLIGFFSDNFMFFAV